MPASVHQVACTEREVLEQLFGVSDRIQQDTNNAVNGDGNTTDDDAGMFPLGRPDVQALIGQVLDRTLEGVCRPLQTRIEPTLSAIVALPESSSLALLVAMNPIA